MSNNTPPEKHTRFSYSASLISTYRTELMGYAILFVMLSHATNPGWADVPVLLQITGKLTALAHTAGFLILSGFGMYYSFSKNKNTASFYKRRLLRLYIPFLLMALPFYLYELVTGGCDFIYFALQETCLAFFVDGGGHVWYIAISLLMYLLVPLLYRIIFCGNNAGLKTSVIVTVMIAFCFCLYTLWPSYYKATEIGYGKMLMFVIGLYIGKLSMSGKSLNQKDFIFIFILIAALAVAQKHVPFLKIFYKDAIPLVGLPILTCLFMACDKYDGKHRILDVFRWLGKYSLELYILHVMFKVTLYYACFDVYGLDADLTTRRFIVTITLLLSFSLCSPIHRCIDKTLAKIT